MIIHWVDSAEWRWTHDKIQRLFTCGLRLEGVVVRSCRCVALTFGFAHEWDRSLGEQVVLTQQSKALVYPRGGCHRGA